MKKSLRYLLYSLLFFLPAQVLAQSVVISQIYGGGGNSGAVWKNDFIELYNPTSSPIDMTGWSVQYASATGTSWSTTALGAKTIAAHGYFLIQEGPGAGGTTALPTPDATGAIAMATGGGKVALVASTTALSGAGPTGLTFVDFVGFGTAGTYQGTGPTPTPTNTACVERKATSGSTAATLASGGSEATAGNGFNTPDNALDFVLQATIVPRNSASPIEPALNTPTLTATPGTLTFGNQTTSIASTAQTFTLSGSNLTDVSTVTTTAPYAVSKDGTTYSTSITYTAAELAATPSPTVSVQFTPSAAGEADGSVSITSTGATTQTVTLTGAGVTPTLTATPTTLAFGNQTTGTTSAAQTFTLSGSNLTTSATVTTTAPYAVSKDGTTYSTSVTYTTAELAATPSPTVSVQFSPSTVATANSSVTITSTNAASQTVTLTGAGVSAPVPTLVATPTSLAFGNQVINTTSTAQTYTLSATNLTDVVTVTTAAPYNVSKDGITYSASISYTTAELATTQTVYVQYSPTAAGAANQSITMASTGALSQTVTLTGTGVIPTLAVNPATLNFTQTTGTTSAAQTYTITGTNLTDVTTVTTTAPYGISKDGTTYSTSLSYTTAELATAQTVHVQFSATADGAANGSITIASTGATSKTITLNGTGITTNHVLISEIYGGGGNTSAIYTNDFVELYNPGSSDVDLSNWSIQYSSATASTWAATSFPSGSKIKSHGFFLIQEASGGATGSALPTADVTGTINLSATAGKVALATYTTALSGAGPAGLIFVDYVGFGTTANGSQGTGPAPAPSATTSIERKASSGSTALTLAAGGSEASAGNGFNTPDNSLDFVAQAGLNPQNSASPIEPAAAVPTLVVTPTTPFTFSQVINTTSASQTFTVSGTNLSAGATVTTAAPYMVSKDGTTFSTSLTYTTTDLATAQTVYVQFTPTATGTANGSISIASTGATSQTVTLNGTGLAAPTLAATPGTLTFTNQVINTTSASQTYSLSGANLTANTTVTTAAPYLVSKDGTTFSTSLTYATADLATAQTVYVQFTPTATGAANGSITIASAGATSQTVTLNGTGVAAPTLAATPGTLTFTNQVTGTTSASQTYSLSGANLTANTTVTTAAPYMVSKDGTTFSTSLTYTTADLATAQTVYVQFTPTATGAANGSITIASAGATSQTVNLNGTGVAPAPVLAVSPNTLAFGNLTINTTSSGQTYTLSGTNLTDVTVVTATAPYAVSKDGVVFSSSISYTTAELATPQTVSVNFAPTALGGSNSTITITSTGATSKTVSVTGTGVAAPIPALTVTPSSLTFSQIVGTTSAAQTYTVSGTNLTGNTTITTAAPYSISKDGTTYSTSISYTTAELASTQTVSVEFSPTAAGTANGSTVQASSGATSQTVTLNGTGLAPTLVATPGTIAFGNQITGTVSTAQTYTLSGTNLTANTTISTTAPYSISKDGTTYSTSISYTPTELATNQTVSVQFSPTAAGAANGSVTIASTGASSQTVTLTGTGVVPALAVTPGTLTFSQTVGTTSAAQTYNLSGTNLTAATTVTTAAPYTISKDGITYSTSLSYSTTELATAHTVSVKFSPTVTGAANGSITIASTGATSQTVTLNGTGIAAPALAATPGSLTFSQTVGTTSAAQTYSLSGSNLTAATTVTTTAPYTISKDGITYSTSLSYSTTELATAQTVSVKFSPTVIGAANGSITIASTGATSQTVTLNGTGIAAPALAATPGSLTFSQTVGTTSAAQTYSLSGSNLTAATTVTTTAPYTISKDGITYSTSLSYSTTELATAQTVSVEFSPTAAGAANGSITIASTGATSQTVTLNGTGTSSGGTTAANHVVLSEVYGGGGNANATYTNDFIELYNPTNADVVITGWSVQYASAAGTSWAATALTGTIKSHGFYLVQLAAGSTASAALPTPDATGTTNMSATAGKVALVNTSTALTGANPTDASIVDLLGFYTNAGSTVTNGYETAYLSGTSTNANGVSFERKANASSTAASLAPGGADVLAGNGYDTDNNSTDFVIQTAVNPQNTASPIEPATTTTTNPTLAATPGTLTFSQTVGTTSAAQTYSLSGSNLTAATTVIATGPYTISKDGITYSTSLSYSTTELATAQTVSVKFSPTVTGAANGSITIASTGATSQTVTLNGTGIAVGAIPTLAVTPSTLTFSQTTGTTSAAQTFSLTGTNLTAATTVTTAAPYTISKDGITYSTSLSYSTTELATAQTVSVKFSPTATGAANGTITMASTGATSQTVTLTGTGTAVVTTPTLAVTPATLTFSDVPGFTTAAQTYTLSATNLTAATTVTTTAPYSISKDGITYGTSISYAIADLATAQTVYVKFSPTVAGASNGSIMNATTGATSQTVTLNGTGTINKSPAIGTIADQTICYSPAQQAIALSGITATEADQSTSITVTSSNPALFSQLGLLPVSATGTSQILYTLAGNVSGTATITVTVKDNGGTANGGVDTYVRTFNMTVNSLAVVNISSDIGTVITKGNTVKLTATGGVQYTWTASTDIVGATNTATITVVPQKTATYTVTATNATGCTTVQTITITVSAVPVAVIASNIITPNGDGKNDTWVIKNINLYPANTVKVFDRTGKIVFSKTGYQNDWNGAQLTQGTYYYVIDLGNSNQYKGYISLLRD